jgi:hypothetical protein
MECFLDGRSFDDRRVTLHRMRKGPLKTGIGVDMKNTDLPLRTGCNPAPEAWSRVPADRSAYSSSRRC